MRIALDVCRGLQALHERELLYLSVTPHNVLVSDRDRRAKVGDLLVALSLQGNLIPYSPQVHNRLDETGCLAPEQLSGLSKQDARADLYSVGVLLYQMLTGEAPFSGTSCEEIAERIQHELPEPPRALNRDVPAKLDALVSRLLAKEPEERFANACDLIKALESFAPAQR